MNLVSISVVFPPAWRHGGTPVAAHAVAKALIHAGHSVKAIVTGCAADGILKLGKWTEWDGVPVIYCHKAPIRYLSYAPSLSSTVRQAVRDCDAALIRSIWQHTGPTAARVCHTMSLPYVAYPEGAFDP